MKNESVCRQTGATTFLLRWSFFTTLLNRLKCVLSYLFRCLRATHSFYSLVITAVRKGAWCDITVAYLCNFRGNSITQHFPVETLLGHIIGEAAGSLEGILQPFQFNISDYRKAERDNLLSLSVSAAFKVCIVSKIQNCVF